MNRIFLGIFALLFSSSASADTSHSVDLLDNGYEISGVAYRMTDGGLMFFLSKKASAFACNGEYESRQAPSIHNCRKIDTSGADTLLKNGYKVTAASYRLSDGGLMVFLSGENRLYGCEGSYSNYRSLPAGVELGSCHEVK